MADQNTPLPVGNSAVPATAYAAIRYIIATAGAFAVGRGWVPADQIEGIVTMLTTIGVVVYGLYKTHQKQGALIDAAPYAPNITKG